MVEKQLSKYTIQSLIFEINLPVLTLGYSSTVVVIVHYIQLLLLYIAIVIV